MRRLAAPLLALLLLATAAIRADGIKGPSEVAPYRLVRLEAEGAFDDAGWLVFPFGVADGAEVGPDGRSFVFTGPPGVYHVVATWFADHKVSQHVHTVTIGPAPPTPPPVPPTPPPTPDPPPTPGPTPIPASDRLWVSYVVPPDATPAQAAIRTSAPLRTALAGLNAEWRTYRSDEEDIARLGLSRSVAKLGPPCCVVQAPDGRVVAELAAPDRTAILSAVQDLRGKRGL